MILFLKKPVHRKKKDPSPNEFPPSVVDLVTHTIYSLKTVTMSGSQYPMDKHIITNTRKAKMLIFQRLCKTSTGTWKVINEYFNAADKPSHRMLPPVSCLGYNKVTNKKKAAIDEVCPARSITKNGDEIQTHVKMMFIGKLFHRGLI